MDTASFKKIIKIQYFRLKSQNYTFGYAPSFSIESKSADEA